MLNGSFVRYDRLFGLVTLAIAASLIGQPTPIVAAAEVAPFFAARQPSTALTVTAASDNWAGYVIYNSMPDQPVAGQGQAAPLTTSIDGFVRAAIPVTDVQGTWVVPAVSCTKARTYSVAWVGIDGVTDGSVEQGGTAQECANGQPLYYAWFETFPDPPQKLPFFPIHVGDTVSVEVQYSAPDLFTIFLKNVTTKKTMKLSRENPTALLESAEWVAEAPSNRLYGVLALAPFGHVTFTQASATVNGKVCAINTCGLPNARTIMAYSNGTVRATVSTLKAYGTSFSVYWQKP